MEVLLNKMYFIAIAYSFVSYSLATDYVNRYTKLQHTSGYDGMAMLAIAATLDDFNAINHFLIKATRQELIDAQAILKSRLDILKNELRQKVPRETIDPVSENQSDRHNRIHRKIYGVKDSLQKISTKLRESD
jgi:hypothetical protein